MRIIYNRQLLTTLIKVEEKNNYALLREMIFYLSLLLILLLLLLEKKFEKTISRPSPLFTRKICKLQKSNQSPCTTHLPEDTRETRHTVNVG